MSDEFRREYLIRLPLPLAQLYCRAHNAKDGRGRHDNCFYLFESLIKLASAPLVAAYVEELRQDGKHAEALDRLLVQLALPSLGQWCGLLRETSRYFGEREGAASHPLGHVWKQLNEKRRDLEGALALFRRIKNGPEGKPAGDQSCSLLQLVDVMVTYRNTVFGHGAGRLTSFYEEEMGPLMFPAVNDVLADGVLDLLGPRDSRLVCLKEVKTVGPGACEVGVRELVGLHCERAAPLKLDSQQASPLLPNQIAILWPGRVEPLLLSPLLAYRESEISEDVLFLNRDRNRKQVEFLSYVTGETTRDKDASPAMNGLLELVSGGKQPAKAANTAEEEEPEASDYEIVAELGRGGMGIVYLARQISLGRHVALKMLPPELQNDEVALVRFRREMRALGRCEHPNVVKVISCGTMPSGELYYAMEYVPGADLEQTWMESSETSKDISVSSLTEESLSGAVLSASQKLRKKTIEKSSAARGKQLAKLDSTDDQPDATARAAELPLLPMLPLPEASKSGNQRGGYARGIVRIMRDAASALQAVHDQHIVHRDVKPANLMLTPDGSRVVLMDFGLAKGDDLAGSPTEAGGFLGTLRYAAPEQLASATMTVGPPADVRGLGVTLWELLTRRKVFGECQDEMQLAKAVNEQDVPRLRSIDPTFDRDLEAIVSRATERRAADRIQSARELANYLDLYLQGKPLPIRTPSVAELLGRWVRSHKALVGTVAAACVVVVLTVIAAFIMITNALHEETLAKEEATANFQVAQDSIDEWLIDVRYAMGYYPDLNVTRQTLLNKAAAEYEAFTKKQSDNRGLQFEFAKSFIRLGDVRLLLEEYDKAQAAFEAGEAAFIELAATDPDNSEIQRQLANTYTGRGMLFGVSQQFEEADEAYQRSVDILDKLLTESNDDPKIRDARARNLNMHAMLFNRREQFEKAEHLLQDAVAEFKIVANATSEARYRRRLFSAHINLAQVLARQAKYAEAVVVCRAAISGYEQLLSEDPGLPEHIDGLATVQLDLAHALREIDLRAAQAAYADAIPTYARLAAENPSKPYYFKNLAIAQLTCAQIFHEFGRNLEAEQLGLDALHTHTLLLESKAPADILLDYHSGNATNLQLVGEVMAAFGEDEMALKYFESAIAREYPTLISADASNQDFRVRLASCHAERGRSLHKLGRHDEAQQAFEIALQEIKAAGDVTDDLTDVLARIQTYQGDLHLQLGKLPEATVAYRLALERRARLTTKPEHLHDLARLLINCQQTELRNPARAIELAGQATALAPHHGNYWNTLAAAYCQAGRLDESMTALEKARQLRLGDDCFDDFCLAMVYWRQDKPELARATYERAVKLMGENRPGDIDALRLRGEVEMLLGAPAVLPENT